MRYPRTEKNFLSNAPRDERTSTRPRDVEIHEALGIIEEIHDWSGATISVPISPVCKFGEHAEPCHNPLRQVIVLPTLNGDVRGFCVLAVCQHHFGVFTEAIRHYKSQ
jgi:hypothetical protein